MCSKEFKEIRQMIKMIYQRYFPINNFNLLKMKELLLPKKLKTSLEKPETNSNKSDKTQDCSQNTLMNRYC